MPLAVATAAHHLDDTIVAVSSAEGAGHRAIVRISGPSTRTVVAAVFEVGTTNSEVGSRNSDRKFCSSDPSSDFRLPTSQIVPGRLRLTGVFSPLPAHLYFFAAPRTYTGQDLAEIHTVGSPPLVERLVADLLLAGARAARPGEFTLRAFLAGKKDLPQAEAVHAVIEAGTDDDLRQALAQLAGGVSHPLKTLREDLLNLLADLEAALDFADEDIEFVSAADTRRRLETALVELSDVYRRLDERTVSGRPVRIALVGQPNVGKTSLFNALAGGDALVSPVPGTTRDYLVKPIDLDGIATELIDTAGWQSAADSIEEQAQHLGREQACRADVIVWCVEAGGEFSSADEARLASTGARIVRVWTKADLIPASGSYLSASVVKPRGTAELWGALAEVAASLARSALAPSQSRCRHHVSACIAELTRARDHVATGDPPELIAACLRIALDQLGELTGAVYTTDLLDRVFSRFCIGK